MAEIGS